MDRVDLFSHFSIVNLTDVIFFGTVSQHFQRQKQSGKCNYTSYWNGEHKKQSEKFSKIILKELKVVCNGWTDYHM